MEVKLSPAAEEVAVFFGRMLDHEYTFEEVFQANFLTDWRKVKPESWIFCQFCEEADKVVWY